MSTIITKTFGGLSTRYYVRQFLFGLIFPVLIMFAMSHGSKAQSVHLGMVSFLIVNTLLYPYSRFVYESVIGFIMGENVFFVNAGMMLFVKAVTMAICWCAAIFIAPIGLAYLHFHHSRTSASNY